MHQRTATGNRRGMITIGALLLICGVGLVGAQQGWYGPATYSVYPPRARRFLHDNQSWLWPTLAAAAILVGLVFLRWLLVQPRTDRIRRLAIDTPDHHDQAPGRTALAASALIDIVTGDIKQIPGIRQATAAVCGTSDTPELWLSLTIHPDSDVTLLRSDLRQAVLPDVRAALDRPDLPVYVNIVVSRRPVNNRTVG